MGIPKATSLSSGQKEFAHDGANWTPLTCSVHAEQGFVKSCEACVGTAKLTIEHAYAVEADKGRA